MNKPLETCAKNHKFCMPVKLTATRGKYLKLPLKTPCIKKRAFMMGKCLFVKQIVLKIQCLRAIIRDASLHQEAFIRNPLHQKTFVHDVKMRTH